jgi:hypothetical protein
MRFWQFRLRRELAAWVQDGHTLSLWWRDDDARGPTPQLDRLLAISERNEVPVALAVIPSVENRALAQRVKGLRGVTVIQHGIDHINRATVNERGAREMATAWSAQDIAARIEATRELRRLPNWVPLFVPPWGHAHACLEKALRTTGFVARSGGGVLESDGLVTIDAHLEVLRWKGGARFRGEGRFMHRLVRLSSERRRARQWTEPIGILTHHLQHDEASWEFLERFVPWAKCNSAIVWRSLPELLEEGLARRRLPPVRQADISVAS